MSHEKLVKLLIDTLPWPWSTPRSVSDILGVLPLTWLLPL